MNTIKRISADVTVKVNAWLIGIYCDAIEHVTRLFIKKLQKRLKSCLKASMVMYDITGDTEYKDLAEKGKDIIIYGESVLNSMDK